MKPLPKGLVSHKRTPEFDERSVPAGLLARHTTASGVWGLIRVTDGSLVYRILEPSVEEHRITQGVPGVIEPGVAHQVEVDRPVRFRVEFYRRP